MRGPSRRVPGLVALFIIALAFGPARAHGGLMTSVSETTTTPQTGGYLYTYTVSNASTSTVGVSEFDVGVFTSITPVSMPADFFNFYTPGDSYISFVAFDSGIAPGTTGTFSFSSSGVPGLQPDLVRGLDTTTFSVVDNPGQVISAVPEPSSLALAGFGVLGVLGLMSRRRPPRVV